MKKFVFIIFLFLQFSSQAQEKADSLLLVLNELNGEAKAHVYNQLSSLYTKSDSALAFHYANKALTIGSQINNSNIIGKSYTNIADTYFANEIYKPALELYLKALDLLKDIDDNNIIGELYRSCGASYMYRNEHDQAITYFFKALTYFETTKNRKSIATTYSYIGHVYSRLLNYNKSSEYYRLALKISNEAQFEENIPVCLNGIAIAYASQSIPDSAMHYFEQSLVRFRQLNKEDKVAAVLHNIARIYRHEGNYTAALNNLNIALTTYKKLTKKEHIVTVLHGMGDVYKSMGNYNQAIDTYNEGLELAKTLEKPYFKLLSFYDDLSYTYEEMGQVDKAFSYFKLYKTYSDSLFEENQIARIDELEAQYQSEKKETEITRLNTEAKIAQLEIQKNKVILLFGIITILLLAAIIAYISYSYNNKRIINVLLQAKNTQIQTQKNELEILNASKNKFFSIIAHDLKNPFHTVMGYSSLLDKGYEQLSDVDRKKYARDIFKSTHSIFRLLQNLLDWSRSQTGNIIFDPIAFDFRGLSENIHSLLKPVADNKKIILEWEIAEQSIVYADPIMVETILRNLVSNAIKFSHENSTIRTTMEIKKDVATICVRDFGLGISKNDLQHLFQIDSKVKRKGTSKEDGSGLGLVLCKDFIEINNGTICAQSELEKGSTFCITLPTAKQEA